MGCLHIKTKREKQMNVPKEPSTSAECNITYEQNNKHLICDDAYTNRLVLKKYLLKFGCIVDEAENGFDAVEKVKENGEYDIIWMDIKMPKMDGHECTNILRNKMNYSGIIIGLTGYVDNDSIKKCISLGMNHVVAKPFDYKIINTYVDEYKSKKK